MTLAAVKVSPRDWLSVSRTRPSFDEIATAVVEHAGISLLDLRSDRRQAPVAQARHIAAYLARHLTPLSYPVIGRLLGGRDHATIMQSVRRVEASEELKAAAREIMRAKGWAAEASE